MSEAGLVLEIKNEGRTAVVAFNRTEACAKCRNCIAGFTKSQMILEAKNGINAQKGDTVLVELPENGFFTASAIVYLFPLLTMATGFFIGGFFADSLGLNADVFAFATGISLLVLSFIIIRLNEKRIKKLPMFQPYIAKIEETSSGDLY